ncbi:MAG: DoxX family protein [Verrucomicrobiota bacterium]
MKIAVIVVRILLGLLFVFSSVVVLFKLVPQPELKGAVKTFMKGIEASVYLLPFIKITELVCGLAFLVGRFVALATVMIFPIVLNIFFYHLFLAREGLPVAVALLAANLFLAYAYRKSYVPMLAAK